MARGQKNDELDNAGAVSPEEQSKSKLGTGDPELGTPVGVETKVPLAQARRQAAEGDTNTKNQDGLSALEAATERGYYGSSPQRIATGLDDKGLSQNTPGVMNQA